MDPRQLSHELRLEDDTHLRNRRRIVGLGLLAAGSMAVITLYQMGMIRHLPEPPIDGLDADEVDASDEAYAKLDMPDAALGLASYSATIGLAAAGGRNRAREKPWLPIALAAKTTVDATQAAKLTLDQWTKHRKFCSWCLVAAAVTFIAAPLAWGEAREAIEHLRSDDQPSSPRRSRPHLPHENPSPYASPYAPPEAARDYRPIST